MKTKKITVKHYLNEKLKPNENGFSVYVRITYNRTNQKQKSDIKERFHNLETLHKVAFSQIETEKTKITRFVKKQLSLNKDFVFKKSRSQKISQKKAIIRNLEVSIKFHKKELVKLEQYNLFNNTNTLK